MLSNQVYMNIPFYSWVTNNSFMNVLLRIQDYTMGQSSIKHLIVNPSHLNNRGSTEYGLIFIFALKRLWMNCNKFLGWYMLPVQDETSKNVCCRGVNLKHRSFKCHTIVQHTISYNWLFSVSNLQNENKSRRISTEFWQNAFL